MYSLKLRWALMCVAATYGTVLASPALASKTVTAKRGDTLHTLARQYGVWPIDIAKANGLPAGSNLKENQHLVIPDPPSAVRAKPVLDRMAYVKGDRITVRLGPGVQYRRATLLDCGAVLRVTAKQGAWCQVSGGPKVQGWIRGDFLGAPSEAILAAARQRLARSAEPESRPKAERVTARKRSSRRYTAHAKTRTYDVSYTAPRARGSRDVVRTALAYRGAPYRYGGSGRRGFDCSGFTSHVYGGKGVALPHSSAAQFSRGRKVPSGSLKPGDLVFFGRGRKAISHVGIYAGDGTFVHAARPGKGVRVDSLNSAYYRESYKGARRVGK